MGVFRAHVLRELACDLNDGEFGGRDDGYDVLAIARRFGPAHREPSARTLTFDVDVRVVG